MDSTVVVALISLAGTLIGSLLGIIATAKLTTYRIEQLEKKVDKHNQVIDRVYKLEQKDAVYAEEMKSVMKKLCDLEGYHKQPKG